MHKLATALAILAVMILAAGPALVADLKPQTKCPVMGGDINKTIFTDYQGQRIYFCCSACIAEFQRDPARYQKKMADQGEAVEPVPAPAPKK
jgi:YHS domain-containing protein